MTCTTVALYSLVDRTHVTSLCSGNMGNSNSGRKHCVIMVSQPSNSGLQQTILANGPLAQQRKLLSTCIIHHQISGLNIRQQQRGLGKQAVLELPKQVFDMRR